MKRDNAFKISRHVKDVNGWLRDPEEPIEYIEERRLAHARVMELNANNTHPESVRYTCRRSSNERKDIK